MKEHEHSASAHLCLEFTNTISARDSSSPNEHLHNYGELLAWSEQTGALPAPLARRLAQVAARNPAAAGAALQAAGELREALYRIFTAHAGGSAPAADDLALLNTLLAQAMPHRQLVAAASGFDWHWEEESVDLPRMLWPVARSAADLLTSADLGRVRECAAEHCTWLFIDRSKNRSRRWCEMQSCGNAAKVRRYRSRKQAAAVHGEA